MASSRFIFPTVLCGSLALPSLAQDAKKTAEPITLANVHKVGLLPEVKQAAMYLEHGPGPNELLLFPRTGNVMVVEIEKPYRSFFSHDSKSFYCLTHAGEFRSWSVDERALE